MPWIKKHKNSFENRIKSLYLHPHLERWQSGRLRRSWKPLNCEVPGVRIPPSPQNWLEKRELAHEADSFFASKGIRTKGRRGHKCSKLHSRPCIYFETRSPKQKYNTLAFPVFRLLLLDIKSQRIHHVRLRNRQETPWSSHIRERLWQRNWQRRTHDDFRPILQKWQVWTR